MNALAYFMYSLNLSGDDLERMARESNTAAAAARFAKANGFAFDAGDTVNAYRQAEIQVPLDRAAGVLLQLCSAKIDPTIVVLYHEDLDADPAAADAAEALEAAASRCGIQIAHD